MVPLGSSGLRHDPRTTSADAGESAAPRPDALHAMSPPPRRATDRSFILFLALGELFRGDADRLLCRWVAAIGREIDQRFDDLFPARTNVQGGVDVDPQRGFRRRGADGSQTCAGAELTGLQI